jgi:hypothetical protein
MGAKGERTTVAGFEEGDAEGGDRGGDEESGKDLQGVVSKGFEFRPRRRRWRWRWRCSIPHSDLLLLCSALFSPVPPLFCCFFLSSSNSLLPTPIVFCFWALCVFSVFSAGVRKHSETEVQVPSSIGDCKIGIRSAIARLEFA